MTGSGPGTPETPSETQVNKDNLNGAYVCSSAFNMKIHMNRDQINKAVKVHRVRSIRVTRLFRSAPIQPDTRRGNIRPDRKASNVRENRTNLGFIKLDEAKLNFPERGWNGGQRAVRDSDDPVLL